MTEGEYVFISYAKGEWPVVERLSADLNQKGIQTWVDKEQIVPGSDWDESVRHGVNHASAMLYLVSKHSSRFGLDRAHLPRALMMKVPVTPVVVDDEGAFLIPASLRDKKPIDLRRGYPEAVEETLKVLGPELRKAHEIEPNEQQSKGYAFISYAEDDAEFVQSLKGFLKDQGYAYWDYEESDRDYHSQLFLELEGVITEAAATLCVLSEAWKRSKWTVKEYFFSEEVGTPVFLLRAKEMGPTLAIAGIAYIDFLEDVGNGFQKLGRELKRKKL